MKVLLFFLILIMLAGCVDRYRNHYGCCGDEPEYYTTRIIYVPHKADSTYGGGSDAR